MWAVRWVMKIQKRVRRSMLLAGVMGLSACSNFAAREHTFAVDGEQVGMVAIKRGQICADNALREGYAKAFEISLPNEKICTASLPAFKAQSFQIEAEPELGKINIQVSPLAIKAATFLADQLFDYVSEELEREADTYEADFSAQLTGEGFYTVRGVTPKAEESSQLLKELTSAHDAKLLEALKLKGKSGATKITQIITHDQQVYGFSLGRTVDAKSNPTCPVLKHDRSGRTSNQQPDAKRALATRIDFGIYYSERNALMRFAPLRYITYCSKAKLPTGLLTLFKPSLKAGDHLFTEITVDLDGFVYDPVKHQFTRVQLLSGQKYTVPSYSMAYEKDQRPVVQPEIGTGTGWMQPVPFHGSGDGAYAISISVYEKDPSNAKKYITKAQTYVTRKHKELITEIEERGDKK